MSINLFTARNLCQTLGCQSGCASSPTGGICTCPQGYKLDERFERSCIGKGYFEN